MSLDEIIKGLELYKQSFKFFINPKELVYFIQGKSDSNFYHKILVFFIINSSLFFAFIFCLNIKKPIPYFVSLIILIQCLLYIPSCIVPLFFSKIEKNIFIKIGVVESLYVLLPLIYFGIVIYYLFLFMESYFFYYSYLVVSFLVFLYICLFIPLSVSTQKKALSVFLTFITCASINYFSYLIEANFLSKDSPLMLDVIYQESIDKTAQIIEFGEYFT